MAPDQGDKLVGVRLRVPTEAQPEQSVKDHAQPTTVGGDCDVRATVITDSGSKIATPNLDRQPDQTAGHTAAEPAEVVQEVEYVQDKPLTSGSSAESMPAPSRGSRSASRRRRSWFTWKLPALLTVLFAVTSGPLLLHLATLPSVQQWFSEQGGLPHIVSGISRGVNSSSVADSALVYGASIAASRLSRNNDVVRHTLSELGVLPPIVAQLDATSASNVTFKHPALFSALRELLDGPSDVKRSFVTAGGIQSLLRYAVPGQSKLASKAAEILAVLTAGNDKDIKSAVQSAKSLPALVSLLQSSHKDVVANAAWAIGNTVAGNTAAQDEVRSNDGIDPLARMLWDGHDAITAHAALTTVGNLAEQNKANQDALNEANAVDAILKLLEQCLGTSASAAAASDVQVDDHMMQKLGEAMKTNAAVRRAVNEVGGLDVLGRLMAGSSQGIVPDDFETWNALVPVKDTANDTASNATSADALQHVRALLKTLQEEVNASKGSSADEPSSAAATSVNAFKRFTSAFQPQSHAILVSKLNKLERSQLAQRCAWALAMLSANNAAIQAQVRQQGGIELLICQLQEGSHSGKIAAAFALGNLASRNEENKQAIKANKGVAAIVKVLSDTDDKDVMNSLARVLKLLAREGYFAEQVRPRRVLGRIGKHSAMLLQNIGINLSPAYALLVFGATVVGLASLLATVLLHEPRKRVVATPASAAASKQKAA